jgi:hypothetical protein
VDLLELLVCLFGDALAPFACSSAALVVGVVCRAAHRPYIQEAGRKQTHTKHLLSKTE